MNEVARRQSMIRKSQFIVFLSSTVLTLLSCAYPPPDASRRSAALHVEYGKASFYGNEFHGRRTASGETFNQNALTAAHPSLPFESICRVTNLSNKKNVVIRINDRGPFVHGRIIDLSYAAAKRIDAVRSGVVEVKVEVLKLGKSKK